MRLRIQLVLSLLALMPAVGVAQLCMGTAPFSSGPVRLGGYAQFTEGAKMMGGSLAFGASGPFASVTAARISFDDFSDNATAYGGQVGFSAPVSANKAAKMCPFAAFDVIRGPNLELFGSQAEFSTKQMTLGLSIGGVVSSTPTLDVIPFASVAYVRGTSEANFQGTTDKSKDDLGSFTVGAGWIVSKVVTIRPSVAFPFGGEDDDPIFAINLFVNLGGKK